ncbi:hypothetical protein MNBD_GAMMA10-1201 [hydrothermal vent metagenome]|uniref:Uncharacterized protein n=1 Tax=hydrothermal vent metagenome TaxID=652676 RepID=A0A3B0Y9Z2_9ZZZZ
MLDISLEDTFGKRYVIKTFQQNTHQGALQPLKFSDKNRAFSFVCGLRVPHGYWQRTLGSIERGSLSSFHCKSDSGQSSPEHRISQYLYYKRIYIYELVNSRAHKDAQGSRSFEQSNGDRYTFNHVSAQLLAGPHQYVALNSETDIADLLRELPCDERQLDELARSLDLGGTPGSGNGHSRARISAGIMAGEIIVSVRPKRVIPPEPVVLQALTAADRPMVVEPALSCQAGEGCACWRCAGYEKSGTDTGRGR